MPFLFLAIAAACWVAILKLQAQRNGGQLTTEDARFGLGCLIFYGFFVS